MPFDVTETTLPGVGKRYEIFLDKDRSIAVLIESSGERTLYYREDQDDDYEEIIQLKDEVARTLGLFLVGAYYQPIAGEIPDETESGEHIEWYSITNESPVRDNTIGEVDIDGTSATLLGIEHDGDVLSSPDSDFTLEVGDRLIVIGSDAAHEEIATLLKP